MTHRSERIAGSWESTILQPETPGQPASQRHRTPRRALSAPWILARSAHHREMPDRIQCNVVVKTGALLRQVHRYSEAIPRGVDCILRARGRRPQTHSADAGVWPSWFSERAAQPFGAGMSVNAGRPGRSYFLERRLRPARPDCCGKGCSR